MEKFKGLKSIFLKLIDKASQKNHQKSDQIKIDCLNYHLGSCQRYFRYLVKDLLLKQFLLMEKTTAIQGHPSRLNDGLFCRTNQYNIPLWLLISRK